MKGQGKDIPGKGHIPKLWGGKEFGSSKKWKESQYKQGPGVGSWGEKP